MNNYAPKLILGVFLMVSLGTACSSHPAQAAVAFDKVTECCTSTTGSSSVAVMQWTHVPVGTPKGVLVFTFVNANADDNTAVTYGGVSMTAVSGGRAVDSAGEPRETKAWFLGNNVPTGTQSVRVTRTNNADVTYGMSITVTAATNTEIYTSGIVLQQADTSLSEQSVSDGSPGTNSVRFAADNSALNSVPVAGANSTVTIGIDFGTSVIQGVRETTAGQGSRSVGFSDGTSDDTAAVYLAVTERLAPTVTTQSATNVAETTATMNGNITALGSATPAVRGFAYGTNSNLAGGDTATTTENGSFTTGAYTDTTVTFTCNTTYYSRAYAINSRGTGFGAISSSFTTSACTTNPSVTTNFATPGDTSAILSGTMTAGLLATDHGFAYSTDAALQSGVSTTSDGALAGNDNFTRLISSLSISQAYFFRAYATNGHGTAYGVIKSFTTGVSTVTRVIRLFKNMRLLNGRMLLNQK